MKVVLDFFARVTLMKEHVQVHTMHLCTLQKNISRDGMRKPLQLQRNKRSSPNSKTKAYLGTQNNLRENGQEKNTWSHNNPACWA